MRAGHSPTSKEVANKGARGNRVPCKSDTSGVLRKTRPYAGGFFRSSWKWPPCGAAVGRHLRHGGDGLPRDAHLYGLTECYGPATSCVFQDGWEALPPALRAARMARQGVRYTTLGDVMVADPATLHAAPDDGASVGEILLRGNT